MPRDEPTDPIAPGFAWGLRFSGTAATPGPHHRIPSPHPCEERPKNQCNDEVTRADFQVMQEMHGAMLRPRKAGGIGSWVYSGPP